MWSWHFNNKTSSIGLWNNFLLNSARILATLVVRHVLVEYELHENFSKHIGKLVCRHGAKPCNKETELLGTLKAGITTT
mgnify:FL=1